MKISIGQFFSDCLISLCSSHFEFNSILILDFHVKLNRQFSKQSIR